MHFFILLSLLDSQNKLHTAKIIPAAKMAFPAQTLHNISETDDGITIQTNFGGLYGVSSVLPPFMNALALEDSPAGEMARALLDIFQQRLYRLHYAIWKHGYIPEHNFGLLNLLTHFLDNTSSTRLADKTKINPKIAGLLIKKPVSHLHLANIIEILTGFRATIKPNTVQWRQAPTIAQPRLGENIILGKRYLDGRRSFDIIIHCETAERLQAFYLDRECQQALRTVLQRCIDPALGYKIHFETNRTNPFMLGGKTSMLGLGACSF